MKQYTSVISILLVLLAVYTALYATWPDSVKDEPQSETSFSTNRAMAHVKEVSPFPHAVGFPGHRHVREYLLGQLRLLGLEPQLQEGHTAGDWGNFSKAVNILARIEGTGDGKALMLLTHYDSNPHSSLGASDAGSGLATILEGLRAYLAKGTQPRNDIIVLFSDAEELGLNGADLFVNQHPWAADVGLVLNFEARGSGGPSYMLIETNQGNSRLVEEFIEANPRFPVANSLAYSVYKMLPNDTDLTVFREDRDIEGFNFAFIDDHFDYHTALDTQERLDPETLAHQGSYLVPLLEHFSQTSLDTLKSAQDLVYFNAPFFGLISYPYTWIWPMFGLACLLFLFLAGIGLYRDTLHWRGMAQGLWVSLVLLAVNGLLGYYCWPLILKLYPQYREILQGFTYNGHSYIAAMVFLSLAICFWSFKKLRKAGVANLLAGPILIWLVIGWAIGTYLPGASFLILPVFALLAAFLVLLLEPEANPYVLVMLGIPAIFILAPLIQMFPVGLGLKMMVTATVLTTLGFFLLLPVFGNYPGRWALGSLCFLLFAGFMAGAHLNSGFSAESPRPSSLLYLMDADRREARWVTYDRELSAWVRAFIKEGKEADRVEDEETISSKYGTDFTFNVPAPLKGVDAPIVRTLQDTVVGSHRQLHLQVLPQRRVNRLEIHTNTSLNRAVINGVPLSEAFLRHRRGSRLLTHYISDNTPTELQLSLPAGQPLELTFYEASNDLLEHPFFSIPPRPEGEIPKPFVLNDAILVKKTFRYE